MAMRVKGEGVEVWEDVVQVRGLRGWLQGYK